MKTLVLLIAASGLLLSGCAHNETHTGPSDVYPPAAPQSVVSTTGDRTVWLNWLPNTEEDVAGYRIYEGPCASGPNCPYSFIGMTTGTSYSINGLDNGVTRFFAVAAVDYAGNESELSYEDVFDTPRPEGFGLRLRTGGIEFRQLEEFVDQHLEAFAALSGDVEVSPAFLQTEVRLLEAQRVEISLQSGQRRPEVVRNIGDQLSAQCVRPFELLQLVCDPQ